jgi:hypothetical protein
MKKGKSRRNRNKYSAVREVNGPATTVTVYKGPLRSVEEAPTVIDVLFDQAISSSAGGVIAFNVADFPLSSPDWANLVATFSQYRVLAMSIKFIPNVTGAAVGVLAYAPLYGVWDAQGSTTAVVLTSYAQATGYSSLKAFSLNEPFRISHKMSSVQEGTFAETGSSAIDYTFKFFATGLTASTNYGRYIAVWHCQFRGRF